MRPVAWAVAVSALFLSGCGDFDGWDQVRESVHYSHDLQPGGTLRIDNSNGRVDIAGWDRNSLDVSGEKYAGSPDLLKRIKVQIQVVGNDVTIHTVRPDGFWMGNGGVRYTIRVPHSITLSSIETTNGSVTAEDIEGPGHLRSTNGSLHLARLQGDYDVGTTNGAIALDQVDGLLTGHTTNGSIKGEMKNGAVKVSTTNGSIDIGLRTAQSTRPLRLETTNGSIRLAIGQLNGNSIDASTTHGSITLRLPSPINARLHASTSFGGIGTDIPLARVEEQSKRKLDGEFGQGGPEVNLSSTTGRIKIERY